MKPWGKLLFSTMRCGLVAAAVVACWQHLPAYDANRTLAEIPDFDFVAEAERLRATERFSEALLVADAGMQTSTDGFELARLTELKTRIETERDDWSRRLKEVGAGALTGRGDSTEALVGAVTSDLFVFGDVRDLVIEGVKWLRGQDNDEVIVALSTAGIVLTVTPAVDLGAALLKFARKVGALSASFAREVRRLALLAVQSRRIDPLAGVADDLVMLNRSARPAGTIAILKHVSDPRDLRAAARLSQQPGGTFALWSGGEDAQRLLRLGPEREALLLRTARKGRAGIGYAADNARWLLLPHPLIGLLKGVYKGNVPKLLADLLMRQAPVVLGLLLGWAAFEFLLFGSRLGRCLSSAPAVKRQAEPVVDEPAPPRKSAQRVEPGTGSAVPASPTRTQRVEPRA